MAYTIEWAENNPYPSFTSQSHYNYILNLLAQQDSWPNATEYFTLLCYVPDDTSLPFHLSKICPINSVTKCDLIHDTPISSHTIWSCYSTNFSPNTNMNGEFWYIRSSNDYFRKITYPNSSSADICRKQMETGGYIFVINHTMPLTIDGTSPRTENVKYGIITPKSINLGTQNTKIYLGNDKIWG